MENLDKAVPKVFQLTETPTLKIGWKDVWTKQAGSKSWYRRATKFGPANLNISRLKRTTNERNKPVIYV